MVRQDLSWSLDPPVESGLYLWAGPHYGKIATYMLREEERNSNGDLCIADQAVKLWVGMWIGPIALPLVYRNIHFGH
jgi:hypothetical protein